MGFFDDIFSAFTGKAQTEAAQKARASLDQQRAELTQRGQAIQGQGLDILGGAQQPMLDAIRNAYGTARGDLNTFDPASNFLSSGVDQAAGAYGQQVGGAMDSILNFSGQATGAVGDYSSRGMESLTGGLAGANAAFDPLQAAAGRYGDERAAAAGMSRDALGLGGPEGNAAATAAFQVSPGYQFNLDQGLESIARNANRAGMLASGNQMQESQRFGSGLANQEFGNWLSRLQGRESLYAPLEASGLGAVGAGRAGAELGTAGRSADLMGATGRNLADIYGGAGRGLADIQSSYGRGLADLFSGEGRNLADLYTGEGKSLAGAAIGGGAAEAGIFGQTAQSQSDLLAKLFGIETPAQTNLGAASSGTFISEGNAKTQASKNLWDFFGNVGKSAISKWG